jgi:DNA-3-methyladenine glycosylase II
MVTPGKPAGIGDAGGIHDERDLARELAALLRLAPELRPVAEAAGPLPLRRHAPDFAGLARIVVGQQVSVASATAINSRLSARFDPLDAPSFARASDADLEGIGLSRAKVATLRGVAVAVENGLDLAGLARAPAGEARSTLLALRGIGPWTADIFLLFCAGHPDIFPAGDAALQEAVRDVLALDRRPSPRELAGLAERWAPHRAVAARLMWAHYRVVLGRGAGVSP